MPNLEWTVPHTIKSVVGELGMNTVDPLTGRLYLVLPGSYKIVPSMRVTQDPISQQSGSVLHPRFKTGLVATLDVRYCIVEDLTGDLPFEISPACDADLREMHELLIAHLDSMMDLSNGVAQRLLWTPAGYGDQRMLDEVQTLAWADPTFNTEGSFWEVQFSIETPFPYALDLTPGTPGTIAAATPTTLTNTGDTKMWPVVKVNGPFTTFTLQNHSQLDDDGNPLKISYDGARPGAAAVAGGHYAELDFFRGTIFLDGNSSDLIAGIDPTVSDFWQLLPDDVLAGGGNSIECDVGSDVLWNNAWA